MGNSCNDVCDVVIAQLEKLGYTFEDDEGAHDEILEALGECHLQRIVPLAKYLEMTIIWQDDGKYFALDAIDKADGDSEELLMGWVGEEAELEDWLRTHAFPNTWTRASRYPEEAAP